MSSMSTTPGQTRGSPRSITAWWRSPSLTVMRFVLLSYCRSGWILGDLVFVWFLYALLYLEFGGDVQYFYSTAGQGLGVLAILSTVVMTRRALSERVYLPLARLTTRSAYVRGLVLATGVLRVPSFALLLALELGYHEFEPLGIRGATVANMIPGALGLLANCIVIATLIVTLTTPIATRRIHIAFFAWLVALLSSHSSIPLLATILGPAQIPLLPLVLCYSLGATQVFDLPGIVGLVADCAYIVALTVLAEHWLSKRDLILH